MKIEYLAPGIVAETLCLALVAKSHQVKIESRHAQNEKQQDGSG